MSDHCSCCAFAQQSPPYDGDGICPKCKTEGEIKYNGGNIYCLACGSYVDCPDQPVSELYAAIAAERRRSERYRDLLEELADEAGLTADGRRLLDSALLSILRGDEDD